MSIGGLIFGGLAVWRLSHGLVKEKGPLDLFARLRAFLASHQKVSGGLFDAVSCVACLSMWVGLVTALWFAQTVFELFAYGLAFSAISMLIESFFSKNLNALPLVAKPATYNKVAVSGSTSPEKGDNVVGHPRPLNLPPTVKT